MSFWRDEIIEFALDHETRRHMDEQITWIEREPGNARPYFHLAQFYRMNGKPQEALGLLLESVRLDPAFADPHAALAEIYAVAGDSAAAWRHARAAECSGDSRAVEMLARHNVPE
jgi:cytochrome c-type biogenesis protein CcmH/NrfG